MDSEVLAAIIGVVGATIGATGAIVAALIVVRWTRSRIPKKRTGRFRKFINALEEVDHDRYEELQWQARRESESHLAMIDQTEKSSILNWIDSIDDEILHVTMDLAELNESQSWTHGITQSTLSNYAAPLGRGRSVEKLSQALLERGILAPSTEVTHPRTYAAQDAESNPSWDFGGMLDRVSPYVEMFRLAEEQEE